MNQLKVNQPFAECQAYLIGSTTPASANARNRNAHESQRPQAVVSA